MNIEVSNNSSNQILTATEFETISNIRTGESPVEGQYDLRPKTYKVFRVPTALLDELREYFVEYTDDLDSDDFDSDGELQQYNEDGTLDRFLRHFVYVERQPKTYNVTVEFTVEAMDENEAEEKVTESISWGADYNITSTYED